MMSWILNWKFESKYKVYMTKNHKSINKLDLPMRKLVYWIYTQRTQDSRSIVLQYH